MTRVGLMLALTFVAGGLAACGGGEGSTVRTVTVAGAAPPPSARTAPPPSAGEDAILIETLITDARLHTGKVLRSSAIGESSFCPGGTSSGGSEGPTITSTFHCRGGTLTVQYAPMQRSLVQGSPWEIVRGTGRFARLRGGGSMVARFGSGESDTGRETFAGTVGTGAG